MSTAKELRQKSPADLQQELLGLRREQFNLRMARATGQSAKPDQFTKVRRNIARLKTIRGEQLRTGQSAAPVAAATPAEAKPAKVAKAKSATAKVATKAKAPKKTAAAKAKG
jgi:large subunit ribosomal protein L29